MNKVFGLLAIVLISTGVLANDKYSMTESFEELKTTTGVSVVTVVDELLNLNDDRLLEVIEGGVAQNEDDLKILLTSLGVDLNNYEVSGLLKSGIKITGYAWDVSVGTVFRVLTYPVRKDKKLRDAFRFGRKSAKNLAKETINFAKGPVVIVNNVLILALNNGVLAVKVVGSTADSAVYYVKEGAKKDPKVRYVRKGTRVEVIKD